MFDVGNMNFFGDSAGHGVDGLGVTMRVLRNGAMVDPVVWGGKNTRRQPGTQRLSWGGGRSDSEVCRSCRICLNSFCYGHLTCRRGPPLSVLINAAGNARRGLARRLHRWIPHGVQMFAMRRA